jgi:hypothetical protein
MEEKINKIINKLIDCVKRKVTPNVSCPICGTSICEGGFYNWSCLNRSCGFFTNDVPHVDEIKDLIKLKQQLEDIKKFGI